MFSFYFRDLGFTTSKFSFLYLIWTWCVHFFVSWWIVLCFALLIWLTYLTLLTRLLPRRQPEQLTRLLPPSFPPERCDIGSFKLLGWTLDHRNLKLPESRWPPLHIYMPMNLAPPVTPRSWGVQCFVVCVCVCVFKCNLLCNVMDNTNCSSFRFVATCEWKTHVFPFFFWIWNSKWIHCGFPMCYSIKKPL